MSDWISYSEKRPETAGVYLWRMPHKTLTGIHVISAAWMRSRGAGYSSVLSTQFDWWDGYRLHVPAGLQWKETSEYQNLKVYDTELVDVEYDGRPLRITQCPYCGKVPKIKAVQRDNFGTTMNPWPSLLNTWWFTCCAWGTTPHESDPVNIETMRRDAFVRAGKLVNR